jgi:secondary thiamine-phosphate synthase enzyme
MKIINHVIKLSTTATLDFIDITEKVEKKIKASRVTNGVINIQSLHTTVAVIVNEAEPLLIEDMKVLLERLAPRTYQYLHDNFKIRTEHMHENELVNGHAHNKAIHLPVSVFLNIQAGRLQLGEWQRVFAIELDQSRPRRIALQILGE